MILAILAILIGLLLPALANGKARARAGRCLINLRQWGLAYQMYADDNDGFLPRRGQGIQALQVVNRPDDWFNALPPYLSLHSLCHMVTNNSKPAAHSESLFICPAATDPGGNYFLPIGMNMNLSPWNMPLAAKLSEVVQPAFVVAMADAPGPYSSTFPSPKPYGIVQRHSGQVNLLFLAGQAKSFPGSYIGCGIGDPRRNDVRWLTGTDADAAAPKY